MKNHLDMENIGVPPLVFKVQFREILSFMNMGLQGTSQRCRVWHNFASTLRKLQAVFDLQEIKEVSWCHRPLNTHGFCEQIDKWIQRK